MGVQARLVLFAASDPVARAAAEAAFDRVAELEAVLSDYRDDSELMRLCSLAGGPPVAVGADLFRVLALSSEFSQATDGAFDVTVGPLVRLWREARRSGALPDRDDLERALELVNHRFVILDRGRGTVRLSEPGMQLDMGGIGKGFAADAAFATLVARGLASVLVDLGGDLRLGDAPPGSAGWRIRLDDGGAVVELANIAVATSGDTAQFLEAGGVRYSHIVDPRTGLGLTHRCRVVVIAPDATSADALASALSVFGPDRGLEFLDHRPGVLAMFRCETPEGLTVRSTPGCPVTAGTDRADR